MAFGGRGSAAATQRATANRLAAIAGGGGAACMEAPAAGGVAAAGASSGQRVSLEPDLSKIRSRSVAHEDPEARKKRLAAKTVNFTATFIARIVILAALGYYAYELYYSTGAIHRGMAVGMVAMVMDFGRVTMKAMEPGTK